MLSKAQNKYIRSLTQQKFRREHNAFIAEGDKIVREWLASGVQVQMIVGLQEWMERNQRLITRHPEASVHIVKDHELQALSALQTSNGALLVIPIPKQDALLPKKEWCLALDDIQDPGNMGTIIRIADWFGIKHIVCSPECVDIYNPKVVQSAMGGHLRVHIHKAELTSFLKNAQIPILAATLDGTNLHDAQRMDAAILVIGNESKGISPAVEALATHRITIPGRGGAESLNAAVSAGILCALLVPC